MPLNNAHGWLKTLLPLAREAGPVMTLAMACMLVVSSWWFAGWLRECADRNRMLGQQLVEEQKAFHQEMRLLINCAKGSNP